MSAGNLYYMYMSVNHMHLELGKNVHTSWHFIQYEANGRNLTATVIRALSIANEVDSVSYDYCKVH